MCLDKSQERVPLKREKPLFTVETVRAELCSEEGKTEMSRVRAGFSERLHSSSKSSFPENAVNPSELHCKGTSRSLIGLMWKAALFSCFALGLMGPSLACSSVIQHPEDVEQIASEESRNTVVAQFLTQARYWSEKGDSVRAEQYYVAAWQAGHPFGEVLPHLLNTCMEGGRLRNALIYIETAQHEEPENAWLKMLSAVLLWSLGDSAQAFQRALEVSAAENAPAEIFYWKGVMFEEYLSDRDAARESFEEYLQRDAQGQWSKQAQAYLARQSTVSL